MFTLISVIVALAGTPATVRFEVAAAPVPSGIGTLIVPELTVTCPGTGGAEESTLNCVPLIPATPPQLTAGVIETFGLGLTVNNAQFETLVAGIHGEHVPLSTAR